MYFCTKDDGDLHEFRTFDADDNREECYNIYYSYIAKKLNNGNSVAAIYQYIDSINIDFYIVMTI